MQCAPFDSLLSADEALTRVFEFCSQHAHSVVEIVGPTASGKTGFSIRVAKLLNKKFTQHSEIISVDSRQIYRGLNISSAKVRPDEMQGIPHHGLDLIDPSQSMNAYEFQQYAYGKIEEIQARDGRVILCGGTMLWLDAISENYQFPKNDVIPACPEPDDRISFSQSKAKHLHACAAPRFPTLKLGLHWDRKTLYARLDERAKDQFANGLIEEVRDVLKQFPHPHHNVETSIGIPEVREYLAGEIGYERALELNQQRNRNYAKRQLTWWRNRNDIFWIDANNL